MKKREEGIERGSRVERDVRGRKRYTRLDFKNRGQGRRKESRVLSKFVKW